jgi:hypothetical protein
VLDLLPQPPAVGSMNSAAILTFGIVAGIVWGGVALLVVTAVRKESRKTRLE